MDVLPLPPRPSLEQYRKQAKDLVKVSRSPDPGAIRAWATGWLENLARLKGVTFTPFVRHSLDRAVSAIEERVRASSPLRLADAQFLIARAHGFAGWGDFATHLGQLFREQAADPEFEGAADAVVSGDLETLQNLLRRHPELIRARSARTHRVTLLHYVAANGVEDFRQLTPPNAVTIARFLLDQGAEVDALANTYGGGKDQTTMNLLVSSMHPAVAGLQAPLAETLLDFGAAINGLEDNGSPLMTALAFGYQKSAEALARRGARVDNVIAAAALGRADLVSQFVVDDHTLRPGVPFVAPAWFGLPNDPKTHIDLAFVWACKFGHTSVVETLLSKGVDPAVTDPDRMTGLHWAAGHRYIDVVHLLLRHAAPLEVKNTWGGTVLDSTDWFACNPPIDHPIGVPDPGYRKLLETLIAAGAEVSAVDFPTGNPEVDEVLRRHGARS